MPVYRMLIVDDEEIITEGLYDVFRKMDLDLDLCKAYSGQEALEWMYRTRVDIVLSDIRMPGMGGLELMENIRKNWPHCKLIFLTGYNDFDYVYTAIQTKGVRYLLKSEGYDKIIRAVTEAITDLENSLKMDNLLQRSRENLHTLETLAQGNYFRYLLQGGNATGDLEGDFRKLSITLDPAFPVLIAIGDVKNGSLYSSFAERQEMTLAVKFLAQDFLEARTKSLGIIDRYGNLFWLIQPLHHPGMGEGDEYTRTVHFLEGQFEMIQRVCKESLDVSVVVTVGSDACEWGQLPSWYDKIRSQQHLRAGDGTEMVETVRLDITEPVSASRERPLRDRSEALTAHLEGGRKEEFLKLFDDLTQPALDVRAKGIPYLIELYYTVALVLLSYLNRWKHDDNIDANALMKYDLQASWHESFRYLRKTAESLFDFRQSSERNRAAAAIDKVRAYIAEHIAEDLSLVHLGNVIHFNPSYLSRLFKQECGVNLSDYIEEMRIEKAKELLRRNDLKIADVGSLTGYEAAHSFTRFFKKMTGVTPQEYREMQRN
nr:response regulator [Paenibacillus aestuarii]